MIINGKTVIISLVDRDTVTRKPFSANIVQWGNNYTQIYAHNFLLGKEFYNLEYLSAYDENGNLTKYVVTRREAYSFGHPTSETLMRVEDEWVEFGDVIESFSCDGCLTLITCYPEWKDSTTVTGRLFLMLIPIEEKETFIR